MIEGASTTDGDGIDPDYRTEAMMHGGDIAESKSDASYDESSDIVGVGKGVLMKGIDDSGSADTGIVTYMMGDVEDDDEVERTQRNDESRNDVDMVIANESSPLLLHEIESSPQPSPDFQNIMIETKGSDVSQVVESNGSDVSQTEIVPAMKHSLSMNSDEKSYNDIQQIPSSSSDIIFNDVPSSPDTQSADFISAAASPSSIQSIVEDALPIEASSDSCSLPVDSDVYAAANAVVPDDIYDADSDVEHSCIPDGPQADDHSVGSDQTPRRILQMN